MISEVTAAYDGIKATASIARGLQSLNTESEKNLAIIDLQRTLLETQQMVLQLQEEAYEMQRQLARARSIDVDDYTLVEITYRGVTFAGRVAYKRSGEAELHFCPVCFGQQILTPI